MTQDLDCQRSADRTASISRTMNVAAKYLFAAHAAPEHLMRWFGPVGYPVTLCAQDFRVGGRFRMAIQLQFAHLVHLD